MSRRDFFAAIAASAIARDALGGVRLFLMGRTDYRLPLSSPYRSGEQPQAHGRLWVTNAVILARDAEKDASALQITYPRRIVWAATTESRRLARNARLTQAVKAGAVGFGELKFHVEADGPGAAARVRACR